MSEVTPNDVAFIKVSSELHMVRNSLAFLEVFKSYALRADNWTKSKLIDLDTSSVLVDECNSFKDIIPYITDDGDKIRNLILRLQKRQKELEKLSDTYLKGGDILVAKLSRD